MTVVVDKNSFERNGTILKEPSQLSNVRVIMDFVQNCLICFTYWLHLRVNR
jgi:hypothetical protein